MAMVFLASPLKEMTQLLAERPPQKSVVKWEGRTRTALCLCFLFLLRKQKMSGAEKLLYIKGLEAVQGARGSYCGTLLVGAGTLLVYLCHGEGNCFRPS